MILSQRDQTSEKLGGFLHIILPGIDGYESFKISVNDLLSGDLQPIFLDNKTGNLSFAVSENTLFKTALFEIISGVPIIRIGTTPSGQEILSDFTCLENNIDVELSYLVEVNGYVYITIQNGSLNLRIDVINNFKNILS